MHMTKAIIFAHDIVGLKIVHWLIEEHSTDILGLIVIKENNIYNLALDANIPVHIYSNDCDC